MHKGEIVVRVVYLKSFWLRYPFKLELSRKLEVALKYFPELEDETIYVGALPEKAIADAVAEPMDMIIRFNPRVKPTYVTIFHELAHLAIFKRVELGEKLPRWSEKYTSIFAMSRIPPELIDEERIPAVTNFPKHKKHLIPELCRKALEYRERHKRDYVRFLIKAIHGFDPWEKLKQLIKAKQKQNITV